MNGRKRIIFIIASVVLAASVGYGVRARAAGIPASAALSYAGVLEDANGPVNATHNLQVILYDAASAGTNLCQSAAAASSIVDGHFSIQLPDACTAAVGASPNVWVDVLVDGSDTGRTPIGAVPYAVEANHAVNATNAASATTATHASMAETATSATTAANASGALQTSITALQAVHPLTQLGSLLVSSTDMDYPACFNQTGEEFPAGACARMAQRNCNVAGYQSGWLEGDLGPGNSISITCIK